MSFRDGEPVPYNTVPVQIDNPQFCFFNIIPDTILKMMKNP